MKRNLLLASLALLLGAAFFWAYGYFSRPVRVVAYVGFNFTDRETLRKNNFTDSLQVTVLNEYLERLNRDAKANGGFRYCLETYECKFEPDSVEPIYRRLAADKRVALVIDNTWGRYIRRAQQVIYQSRLPVIALSADRNESNFGNTALFLEPNDPKPQYIINYVQKVLGARRIGYITEDDYLLHRQFVRLFEKDSLGCDTLAIFKQGALQNNQVADADTQAVRRKMYEALIKTSQTIIALNLHSAYGDILFKMLRQEGRRIPPKTFIGLPGVTRSKSEELEKISRETGHVFIRLDNSTDALPVELHRDRTKFKQRLPEAYFKDQRLAENALRRCYTAMRIFEIALRQGRHDRSALTAFFSGLPTRKIVLGNDLYEFDQDNILRIEPEFVEVDSGLTYSSPQQINLRGEVIPNLRVGIDIQNISGIDVKQNSFECNLLYWVIADTASIGKEDYIGFENISSNQTKKDLIAREQRDHGKFVVKIYRVSGRFLNDFNSFDFPFDHHEIHIPVSALSSSEELQVSFDVSRLQRLAQDSFNLDDWRTGEAYVTLDNRPANRLGAVEKIDTSDIAKNLVKYKSLTIRLPISRPPWGAFILIILPFLMFSVLPLFMLFFHKISFDDIGELIITSFLAAVAYSINLVQLSPSTDSMNKAYLFLLLTLAVNFLCFLYVTYADKQQNRPAGKGKKLKVGKLSVPYFILILFIMLCYFIFR